MASIFSHAVASCSLGYVCYGKVSRKSFWLCCALLGMLPDADVIGFRFGIKYEDLLGHRGFFHSLIFSALVGFVAMIWYKRYVEVQRSSLRLWLFFACAMATHPILDAFTTGGLGVAFLSPFDPTRYFFAMQVIKVSPIKISAFFSSRGIEVLLSELRWVWLPCLIAVGAAWMARRKVVRE